MRLTPTERDRLLLFGAAELARARRARGLKLNVPEATALIADTVCEAARDGRRLAQAIEAARDVLGPERRAARRRRRRDRGACRGGLRRRLTPRGGLRPDRGRPPGARRAGRASCPAPADAEPEPALRLTVRNTATVPVSVTSHFHFFEANPRLDFDRAAAYGMRLCVPAGSSVRFDPGAESEVGLLPIGGARVAIGFAGLVDGPLDAPGAKEEALRRAAACGYLGALAHQEGDR